MSTKGKTWEVPHRQRYKDIITRDVLLNATINYVSDYKLAFKLNVPHTAVQWYRKKYSIPSGRSKDNIARIKNTWLPDATLGLIVGTVLGDSMLRKTKDGVYLSIQHGRKQKEYVWHKYNMLKNICLYDPVDDENNSGYQDCTESTRFTTVHHPDLEKLYDIIYIDGKKSITKDALDILTIAGFTWWYFDDGSCSKHQNQFYLHVSNYPLEQVKLLRQWMFRQLKLKSTPIVDFRRKVHKKYYKLYIPASCREKFIQYMEPFVIPSLLYKLNRSPETTR